MSTHLAAAAPAISAYDDPASRIIGLFDAHHEALYRLARRLAPGADEARDLVQDTFLRVAKAPHRVPRGHSQEEAWLVRVLINLRRDAWRRERVRAGALRATRQPAAADARQEAQLAAHSAIWAALDRLSPRRRAVIVLHELEGKSMSSVASLLGISTITVRWHLSQGRRELKTHLRPLLGDTL